MKDFFYENKTRILFGKNREEETGKETARYSRNILFHYGGGSIKKSGLYDKVKNSLKDADVNFIELGGVQPNPRLSLVEEGIKICREKGINFILAVGGGSVIDSAKAIAAGTVFEGKIWDAYLRKVQPTEALPVGVVLTIPAAGSESSIGSVITNEAESSKRAIDYPFLRPVFAIMNPEITFTLPPFQTACGVVDMMCHVMERYFTSVKNVDFTDRLCEATLRAIIRNAPLVMDNPENYNARAEIMWAGAVAHNDLIGTGRTGDWASHDIEHELSAFYDIAHGAGLAAIFPAWLKFVYRESPEKVIQFAIRVWDVEYDMDNPLRTAEEGIKRLESFFSSLGLSTRLKDMGIDNTRFEEMAARATADRLLGDYKKLSSTDVLQIYKLAESFKI